MIDCEKLISCVYSRRPIWDVNMKAHSNIPYIEKLWNEISSEMNIDEIKLRKKWKYLRDHFAIETGKIRLKQQRGLLSDNEICRWQYYKSLTFLKAIQRRKEQVKRKSYKEEEEDTQISVITADSYDSLSFDDESNKCELEEIFIDKEAIVVQTTPTGNKTRRLDRSELKPHETTTSSSFSKRNERIPSEQEVNEFNEENMSFFKSLMPHVNKIHPEKILVFRNTIQKLVQEFAYPPSPIHIKAVRTIPSTAQFISINEGACKEEPDINFMTQVNFE